MKIEDIEYAYKRIPLEKAFATSSGGVSSSSSLFVKISTDEGIVGYGSGYPTSLTDEDVKSALYFSDLFKQAFKNKNPKRLEHLSSLMDGVTYGNPAVKFAFSTALWDIFGKAHGTPLYELLGYDKPKIHTSITIGVGGIESMVKDAEFWRRKGFGHFKIKLGGDPQQGYEAVSAIRNALGVDSILRCDANGAMSLPDANRFIKLSKDLDIEFLEQPVSVEGDMCEITGSSKIRIAADETILGRSQFANALSRGCMHIANIKLNRFGGIGNGLKMIHTAELYDIPCMLGCMSENAISIAASLHLALSSCNVKYADLDTFLFLKYQPAKGVMIKKGIMKPSEAPGLGVDVEKKIFKKDSMPSLSKS